MKNVNPKTPQQRGEEARQRIADQQRAHRRRNRGSVVEADWGTASADSVSSAICAVTQHGYAIRFGYTRDGGAFAIGIIGDGDPFTEFVRPNEDIDAYLNGLADDYRHKEGDGS
jgi:hypothetical protein